MSVHSHIESIDATWNPVRGRKKIREQLLAGGFGAPQAESSGA